MKISSLQYGELVKEYSPNSHLWIDTLNAFWTGGLICVLGQLILKGWGLLGLDQDGASTATAISMVFLGALCTGIGIYDRIAQLAGAGTVVPITGFANSMVAPAIEYKKEGPVLGVGANMFKVAGPVLVCGIAAGTVVGIIYWLIEKF